MKRALLAATLFPIPLAAQAQPVSGFYVGAGAGGNYMPSEKTENIEKTTRTGPAIVGPVAGGFGPSFTDVFRYKTPFDYGVATVASVGYGFGNGFRAEIEGDYRYNHWEHYSNYDIGEKKFGGMGNVLFDFDIGSRYIWPYAGIGAGYMRVDHGNSNTPSNAFAYQGITGVSFPIPYVVGLSATLEYRVQALASSEYKSGSANVFGTSSAKEKFYNDLNHSALLGLRYAFNVTPPAFPPAAAPTPAPTAAPVALPTRSYLVFFDWDRADLSDRARQIIAEAAQNIARAAHTRIEVAGHADRTGTAKYNQALSLRRAQTVAAELVRLGVARGDIDIEAFGDTHPLVPTAAGVREPQNRRVEIVIH